MIHLSPSQLNYSSAEKRIDKISMFCAIWLTFVQFKKREKHPWRSATFSNIAGI